MADVSQHIISALQHHIHLALNEAGCSQDIPCHIAVAYSGGVDSSVLLHLLAQSLKGTPHVLHAFHVHHGLSSHADSWVSHCEMVTKALSVPLHVSRVTLTDVSTVGVEDAARSARYAALDALCAAHHIQYLFLAHHQDDQVETILLHLCRGTGLNGLVGMEAVSVSPLLSVSQVQVVRPWLALSKADIHQVAQSLQIEHIEDESNQDIRYTRNTLRHRVIPVLNACFPQIEQRFLRLSENAASARRLLKEVAVSDASGIIKNNTLDIEAMRPMSRERQMNLLQYWLEQQDCRVASAAWLSELHHQLFGSKSDAQLCVRLGNASVRRFEGQAHYVANSEVIPLPLVPAAFQWQGESVLSFPDFRGKLVFKPAGKGVDADWLKAQSLLLCARTGGEVLRLSDRRPSKSLKVWFQEKHIPAWQRAVLPLIKTDQQQLIFAAGLGVNIVNAVQTTNGHAVDISWQPL